tara:strand:+ start:113 stop:412 length:300 start_codon:yes stop_codon:yes gene_type:complete
MTFISIIIIIASILLVLVVLIQNSKGGGLDSNLASQSQVFGAKKTTELIEKITWGLAAALIIFSVISTKMISQNESIDDDQETIENTEGIDEENPDKEG